jgi:hypothetical protein
LYSILFGDKQTLSKKIGSTLAKYAINLNEERNRWPSPSVALSTSTQVLSAAIPKAKPDEIGNETVPMVEIELP